MSPGSAETYFLFKFGATLCFECGAAAGGTASGLKELPLERAVRCDKCGRKAIPGVGLVDPPERVDPSPPSAELAVRWESSSLAALEQMSENEGFDRNWRPDTYGAVAENEESVDGPDERDEDEGGLLPGEVRIATLHISSGLGNSVTICASSSGTGIRFRAFDEYESDISLSPETATKPLTYEELLGLVKSLEFGGPMLEGPLWWSRELEAEVDIFEAAEFITGSSDVYPLFDDLIDADNAVWLAAQTDDDVEDDDEEDG